MIYIEHDGEQITRVFSASEPTIGAVEVSQDFSGHTGMPIVAYDEAWNLRPMEELVAERIVPTPDGYTWDAELDDLRKMTQAEKVETGELILGDRQIVDGDYVREMTFPELDERGLLTQEEKSEWETNKALSRLDQIDKESARPLRAITAGVDVPYDHQRLADLESEAESLRNQLAQASANEEEA